MDPNTTTQPAQEISYTEHSAPVAWPPRARSRRRNGRRKLAASAAAFLVAGGGTFLVLRAANVGLLKDSGVAVCETMAGGGDSGDSSSAGDGEITWAEYLRLRGRFAGSRYDDLRETGTAFADNMWLMSGRVNNPAPSLADLADGRDLVLSFRALKSACADHGHPVS